MTNVQQIKLFLHILITGLNLGGSLGEVLQICLTSPYFELREKFECTRRAFREILSKNPKFSLIAAQPSPLWKL